MSHLSKLFFRVTGLNIVAPAFFLDSDCYELVTRVAVSGFGAISPD